VSTNFFVAIFLHFSFSKGPKQHGREHSENFLKESQHFEEENYEIIKL
jgi:hypothetical protein